MKKFTPPAKKSAPPAPPAKKPAKHTGFTIPTKDQKAGSGYFGA